MKLLIYTINYAPELTGVGKYSAEMAEWLVGRGHEVRVITALPYYPEWKVQPGFQADTTAPCPRSSKPGLFGDAELDLGARASNRCSANTAFAEFRFGFIASAPARVAQEA